MRYWGSASRRDYSGESGQRRLERAQYRKARQLQASERHCFSNACRTVRKPALLQASERHCFSNACRTVRKPALLKPRRGVPSIALVSASRIERSSGGATPTCLRAYTHREACLRAGRHRRSNGPDRIGVAPPGLRVVGGAFLPRASSCLRGRQVGHPVGY